MDYLEEKTKEEQLENAIELTLDVLVNGQLEDKDFAELCKSAAELYKAKIQEESAKADQQAHAEDLAFQEKKVTLEGESRIAVAKIERQISWIDFAKSVVGLAANTVWINGLLKYEKDGTIITSKAFQFITKGFRH